MALVTKDEAHELVSPIQHTLLVQPRLKAVGTWNDFLSTAPSVAATLSTTTRAGMVHDFTRHEVRAALLQCSGAREVQALGFFAVAIGPKLLIRFKYVPDGLPHNVSTERQDRLSKQQYDDADMAALTLEGIPRPPTLVTCGYTLSPDGTVGVLSIQCDYAGFVYWRFPIWGDPDTGTLGNFSYTPLSPDLAPTATVVRSSRKDTANSEADVQ